MLSSKVTTHRKKTETRYFQVAVRLAWSPLKRISSSMGTNDMMAVMIGRVGEGKCEGFEREI